MSKIEWTGRTWNFLKGCNLVSKGCENCYAMRMAWRLQNNPKMAKEYEGTTRKTAGGKIQWTGKVNIDEERMLLPLKIKKPTVWFVNSMSDLFHESVPFATIYEAFKVMQQCEQHTFQILTKRPDVMLRFYRDYAQIKEPLPNVWVGVSVEDQESTNDRVLYMTEIPAVVRFLSCEPLLGPINLYPLLELTIEHRTGKPGSAIDWIICGGESGPGARPMHPDWARSLRDQCKRAGVAFFFKQWGEWYPYSDNMEELFGPDYSLLKHYRFDDNTFMFKVGKKNAGRLLDGVLHDEFPKPLSV